MPTRDRPDLAPRPEPFPGRFLFVPVSSPCGMGEYARSREIGLAVRHRWPAADIHFVLSRAAPYAADCPFPVTLLPSSPTFHPREVSQLIAAQRPDVVIFDNAGRTAQLRAAVRAGARVVYVSSRRRQRGKAFRLHWMRLIDEHWIASPALIAGPLTWTEKTKLGLMGRPLIRHLDTLLPPDDPARRGALLARCALEAGRYLAVVPGGGTAHKGAAQAPAVFREAAERLARLGHCVVLVGPGPSHSADWPAGHGLQMTGRLPSADLVALLRDARLVLTNGGDTLLQALAVERPCVASPVAHDQAGRIARCIAAGLGVAGSPLSVPEMVAAVTRRLQEPDRAHPAVRPPLLNALDLAVESLSALAGRAPAAVGSAPLTRSSAAPHH